MKMSDLDQRLARKNLQGFWAMEVQSSEKKPYLWKWDDIYESLQLASEHVPMDQTGRRAIMVGIPIHPEASRRR